MALVHLLSMTALALVQAQGAEHPARAGVEAPAKVPAEQAPRTEAAPARLGLVQPGAPALARDRTSRCFDRAGGGRWRAQCDATTKRCLVAPDVELSEEGEPRGDLERIGACVLPGWREDDLAPQGYQMIPALAEVPPGWQRDERQRIMQVNFDLARRVWLGAGYGTGSWPWTDQGEATAGVRWDVPFHMLGAPALARLRALETYAAFDGNATDFTLFGLDASRAYPSPLLRFTTFVGKPRRFDPPLYVGFWLEAVRVESLRLESRRWFDRISYGAAALTVDLWRSRDLGSFLRVRGGAGYEGVEQLEGGAWVPHAALDVDATLDEGGFNHLRLTAMSEWILPASDGELQPKDPTLPRLPQERHRYTAKVELERILIAVNDQPISVVLDGRAQSRDDVPELDPERWFFQATASLRFNLFAPPRRGAPVQDKL